MKIKKKRMPSGAQLYQKLRHLSLITTAKELQRLSRFDRQVELLQIRILQKSPELKALLKRRDDFEIRVNDRDDKLSDERITLLNQINDRCNAAQRMTPELVAAVDSLIKRIQARK